MERKDIENLLRASVLAQQELSVSGIASTQLAVVLWGDMTTEDREHTVVVLTQAHHCLGERIRGADLKDESQRKELNKLIAYGNKVLTREAVLAGTYPQDFGPYAVALKDILLEALADLWNRYSVPGTSVSLDEIVQVFRDTMEELGLTGIKPTK